MNPVNLYDKSFEHDNCGIGAVVNIKGIKSHKTVEDALTISLKPLNTVQAKMPREKQATVWEYFFRFHINSLKE